MYQLVQTKAEAFEQLKRLIEAFASQEAYYQTDAYKEAQLRIDFLNPFLKTFGWDVDNELRKSQFLRDVIQEEEVGVEEDDLVKMKNPDYTLLIMGSRKLFVEAKKVSVDINTALAPAFQTRRYGWSADLDISVLTNFEYLRIYDCRFQPYPSDGPQTALYRNYYYKDFINNFDELYDLLSFSSVTNGSIERAIEQEPHSSSPFDEFFLKQILDWRQRLAQEIITNNPALNEEELNFQVQRLLNRIIFLRICEDREIEKYASLREVTSYDELKALFLHADRKYNSGLFNFIEDELSLTLRLEAQVLIDIFNELYYPLSPFDFSVVDPEILSQIYERFLGSRITYTTDGQVIIVQEPEVAASDGVVPTPKLVVRKILRETLQHIVDSKSFDEILNLKIADISCGSGAFLISAYDYLLEQLTERITEVQLGNGLARLGPNDIKQLTLKAKQFILTKCLYGVDINPYAVEVSRFSLVLKLIEGETAATINEHSHRGAKVLPSLNENIRCGNSLIDNRYFSFNTEALDDDELCFKIRPFEWREEFTFLGDTQGFDAIIGNPPYVRIQHMVKYAPEEIQYYQSEEAGYSAIASGSSFDKYYLFIERALTLLNPTGYLGYIVPNKFFTLKGASILRNYIQNNSAIAKIIHFGVVQLFPGRLTYTAILILSKQARSTFLFSKPRNTTLDLVEDIAVSPYLNSEFALEPWLFVSPETKSLFERIRANNTVPLLSIADIPVGLQTSADDIYIFHPTGETATTFFFKDREDQPWEIEKDICVPCLLDVQLQAFDTISANAWMIYTYRNAGGKAELIEEDIFKIDFPLCWAYLNHFKGSLSRRSITGVKDPDTKIPIWYQFGRTQNLNKFIDSPKILFSVLSKHAKYVYDEANIQFTGGGNGPYYSIISHSAYSNLYIMAILSHPVFEAMVKSKTSEFQGGYYSHGKQFLKDLPIKTINFASDGERAQHDAIVSTVQRMINTVATIKAIVNETNREALKRRYRQLHTSMVNQVNQLYGLSEDDLRIVAEDELLYPPANDGL